MPIHRKMFKRQSIRYNPDPGALAQIELGTKKAGTEFQPTLVGLIADESTKGCGVVLLEITDLQVGETCRIQVGQMAPIYSEVRWRKVIDSGIIRLGLRYLE